MPFVTAALCDLETDVPLLNAVTLPEWSLPFRTH